MATSLAEINAQIATIEAQADELRRQAAVLKLKERDSVIAEVIAKIHEHGLTASDLKLGGGSRSKKPSSRWVKAAPKYRNAQGEEWSGGRGRKPKWVTDAVAAGKSLSEFEIK